MSSIKGNILLNGINTLTGIIYPVITFPYAARVLLPEGIGVINFLNSIIGYIVLLTSLGIPMYAVKEVAKYRDDKFTRDKITIEIIGLSTILCIIGYVIVWLLAEFIPQVHHQAALFYILSLTIVFTAIGVNWFYQGIEDFKFITIRAIIIRTCAAVALFIFVKKPTDLLIYGMITVGSTVGNNFINFVHLRRYIDIRIFCFRELSFMRHLKPALQVFILNLIVSLYIQLNSIMLGFMSGDKEVGYFTAGTKITHIALTLITSLSTVLLPRCSHLLKIGDRYGFASVINKSLNVTLGLSLPMTVGLILLAAPITIIFCGEAFIYSIPILYLNAPVIIFISLTTLIGIQVLYTMDKVNLVILSVSVAAILNLILNFILIPPYGATGAAISTLIAEFSVLLFQIICGSRYFPFNLLDLFKFKYVVATIIMGISVHIAIIHIQSDVMKLIIGLCVGFSVYLMTLIVLKDSLVMGILATVKNKIGNEN